jgi:UDP-N-acetyl-D-glucosamine dehydrogenase
MSGYSTLKDRISDTTARVCVVGLGYVGLPLAVLAARRGFKVYGFDTNASRVQKLKSGQQYIVDVDFREIKRLIRQEKFLPSTRKEVLSGSDIIIICVPTPLRKVKIPDISYMVEAAKTIKNYLRKGQLVVLESTSYPTTTRGVILPILQKSGLKEERDFFLCFSPERVNPGDKRFPLSKISKIIGGLSPKSRDLARNFYSRLIKKVYTVRSPEVAESAKLLENTFRLVNIALVNEFAIVAHKMGISIWEVIEAAKTKPFGFMPFYPGPGVGGHCIPDDPVFLSWKAKKLGFTTKMIDQASYMNRYMPRYIVKRVQDELKKKKKLFGDSRILILGVTYKKDVKDLRESPALSIIEMLQAKGASVDFYDPLIPYLRIRNIDLKGMKVGPEKLQRYDCVIITVANSGIDYGYIQKKARLVFDTRNIYKKQYPNVVKL